MREIPPPPPPPVPPPRDYHYIPPSKRKGHENLPLHRLWGGLVQRNQSIDFWDHLVDTSDQWSVSKGNH